MPTSNAAKRLDAFKASTGVYANPEPKGSKHQQLVVTRAQLTKAQRRLAAVDDVIESLSTMSHGKGGDTAFRSGLAFAAGKLREALR